MAEANALSLTMLQYCEISRICTMGFEINLKEDTNYLQESLSNTCVYFYASEHFPFRDSSLKRVTKSLNKTSSVPVMGVLAHSGFSPFPLLQIDTCLFSYRLPHNMQKVNKIKTFVPGTKLKQSIHLNKKGSISIFKPNQVKICENRACNAFFITSSIENKTRFS